MKILSSAWRKVLATITAGGLCVAGVSYVVASSSGNPLPALTGAPSENLCVDCHASFPLNSGPGLLTLQLPSTYEPGGLYPVRVRLQQPGQSRWGFQVTALTAGEQMAGSFIIVDTLRTQRQQSTFLNRWYVNHRAAGTYPDSANGPVEWLFHWRAPSANVGSIVFYAAGIAANQNGDPTGDYVYTKKGTLTPGAVADSLKFRSFHPDSLITKRPVKRNPVNTQWSTLFPNNTDQIVSSLTIEFRDPVQLTEYAPFPDAVGSNNGKLWTISGQQLAPGDSVRIGGIGPDDVTEIRRWKWDGHELNNGFTPIGQSYLFPMPNDANVRHEVYEWGGFAPGTPESDTLGGMVVGKSFLRYRSGRWSVDFENARRFGWARLKRPTSMLRSMVYRSAITHTGDPRGFCQLDNGRPFRRQLNSLPPRKMNNRLVAEMIALKMNIATSTLSVTPVGFGELIYQDPGHPLNNQMVRTISVIADSMVTHCAGRELAQYVMIDSVLRKINRAFAGPIDTVSFVDSLVLTGVRTVSEVSFLRPNPDVPPTRVPRVYHAEYAYDEEEEELEEMEELDIIPDVIGISTNYPNPFNPTTAIQFHLNEFAYLTITVYDVLGQEIRTLIDNEVFSDGQNEILFDAERLSSGLYFYRITAESLDEPGRKNVSLGKMLLLK